MRVLETFPKEDKAVTFLFPDHILVIKLFLDHFRFVTLSGYGCLLVKRPMRRLTDASGPDFPNWVFCQRSPTIVYFLDVLDSLVSSYRRTRPSLSHNRRFDLVLQFLFVCIYSQAPPMRRRLRDLCQSPSQSSLSLTKGRFQMRRYALDAIVTVSSDKQMHFPTPRFYVNWRLSL